AARGAWAPRAEADLRAARGVRAALAGRDRRGARGSMNASVSVLICVFNKLDHTRRCLERLLSERAPHLREIVIVDNGSTHRPPPYLDDLAAREPLVRVLSPGENLGFVGGNNLAASHASGDYLVLLNNDTQPRDGWLEALVGTAERDPS